MPVSDHSRSPHSTWRTESTLLAPALMLIGVLAVISLGHGGRRIAQVMLLALPMLALLLMPVRAPRLHALRSIAVWLWAMAFALDSAARAYLQETYQAAPDSAMVVGAVANATARETSEYLSLQWRPVAGWCAMLVFSALVFGWAARRGARTVVAWPRGTVVLLCAALLVSSVGYSLYPWRRLHPAIFWLNWNESVDSLRAGWLNSEGARARKLARAALAAPALTQSGPATVVLVIGESINRDNLGLYGYGRATTPGLSAQKAELKDELLVLRNAWSVDASTLPALHNLFNFGTPQRDDPQHLIALARAAGYKVWWLSNHDDLGIEQEHARLANVVQMMNRTPGRSGTSLDGVLLEGLRSALGDAAERKLVVVHMMGAHPYYSLRYPEGEGTLFDDPADAVEKEMRARGRSAWVRGSRREYDTAVLYHDAVVTQTLQMTRRAGRAGEHRAWMYLSDHGQEVGHSSDRAGHSPTTASGYRIPAMMWQSGPQRAFSAKVADSPFRADWAAWSVCDLLQVQCHPKATTRNVLRENYEWMAPQLAAPVTAFVD